VFFVSELSTSHFLFLGLVSLFSGWNAEEKNKFSKLISFLDCAFCKNYLMSAATGIKAAEQRDVKESLNLMARLSSQQEIFARRLLALQ